MRFPRFRFTIRRSMALVAIVAVLLGSGVTVQRLRHLHRVYQERAVHHEISEQFARNLLTTVSEMTAEYKKASQQMTEAQAEAKKAVEAVKLDPEAEKRWKELAKTDPFLKEFASDQPQEAKLFDDMVKPLEEFMKVASSDMGYHAQLKRKFERAAARPWISVSPDDERAQVDLMEIYLEAVEKSESKAQALDHPPLPPRLEMIEPESPGKK